MTTATDDDYHWLLCPECSAGITEVDIKLNRCTQCKRRLSVKETRTMITTEDAFELVLRLARDVAQTDEEIESCNVVEDFVVNQLGDN